MAMTHLYSQAIDVHYKSETSCIVVLKACLFIISQDKENDLYLVCPLSDPNSGVFMENCSQFDWWNPKMSKMEPKISNCAGSQLWPSMLVLFLQKKLRKQVKVREVLFKIKKEEKNIEIWMKVRNLLSAFLTRANCEKIKWFSHNEANRCLSPFWNKYS